MTLGAVVLCAGESRRMGRPKAWLPFGPEVLLQRVVRLVGEAVGPVVIVAAPGQALPTLPESVPIVRDVVDAEALRAVDPRFQTLSNLNAPEDYLGALAEAGLGPTS